MSRKKLAGMLVALALLLCSSCNKTSDEFTKTDSSNGYLMQSVDLPDDPKCHNEIIMVDSNSSGNHALELSYSIDPHDGIKYLTFFDFDDKGSITLSTKIECDVSINDPIASMADDHILIPLASGEVSLIDPCTGVEKATSHTGNTGIILGIKQVSDGIIIVREGCVAKYDKELNVQKEITDNRITQVYNNTIFEDNGKLYIGMYDGYYRADFDKGIIERAIDYKELPLLFPEPCGEYIVSEEGFFELNMGDHLVNTLADFNYVSIRPGSRANTARYFGIDKTHFAKCYSYYRGSAEMDLYTYDESIDYAKAKKIVIGGYGVTNDDLIKKAVYNFNVSREDYRIYLDDYSVDYGYENAEEAQAALLRLMKHFSDGYAPDIYYGEGFDYKYMGTHGMVCDLKKYIDNSDIRSKIYPSIAGTMFDGGECYSVFAAVTLDGYWGLKDNFENGNISFEELTEKAGNEGIKPVNTSFAYDIVDSVVRYPLEEYVNRMTGDNVLESDDLHRILDFALQNGVGSSEEMMNSSLLSMKDGEVLVERAMISNIYGYNSYSGPYAHKPLNYLGFPAVRASIHSIRATGLCAVSDSSENKDICWEFISSLFDDDVQRMAVSAGLTPVCTGMIEDMLKYAEHPDLAKGDDVFEDYVEFGNNGEAIGNDVVCEYRNALDQIDNVIIQDWGVFNIIHDEVMSYYLQGKTPEEIAVSLQSRLGVYIREHNN